MRPQHRRHLYTLLHHLLLATTISSALVVVESWPKFQAVDNRTHFALSYVRAKLWMLLPAWFPGRVLPPDRYPLVLVLDAQQRRQAKTVAAGLVETVSAEWATRPENKGRGVLAFELDLDPSEHDRQGQDQDVLDRALDAAARNKIGVVLWIPDFRTGPEWLLRERLGWMRARCAAGVRFGVEEPRPVPDAVHSYWKNYPSIGVVAARAGSAGPPPEPRTAHGRGRVPDYDICDAVRTAGHDVRLFLDRLRQTMPSPGLEHETPLDSSFFQYSENVYDAAFNPTRAWPTPEAVRAAPAVFVGAPTPERATFFGYTIPTMAALYAAEFFTEWNPVKPVGKWAAFGFDVALGLVLGYVFAFTWEAFARAEERLQDTRLFPVVRSLPRKAGRYLVARALLLGNLALLAGALAGCVLLSGRMLESRNWLNPLPIVLGTSIDGLLHSRTRPDSAEPQTWRTFLTKRSDIVPQLAIIAWAIWHLVR